MTDEQQKPETTGKRKARKQLQDLAGRSTYGLNYWNHIIDSRQAIQLAGRGESPSSKTNITQSLICVKVCCGNWVYSL